ncbi:hypothetical protein GC796_08585 [Salmonella enterica]|uniref:Uncharacterized protein n=2 Tax=Salmonella enterica TaxID=28901 RepID=A0A756IY86_SALER|nr:hypothetical protein [Salmonella enterica subsp. enterica serovar Javiana]EAM5564491.1 hypothetical protein [Salmonella enterica]ECE5830319.1 hypothetical protein [Salmonella enterica subsp. enterica]ECU5731691.1 hypothetical protein [Salmonella enterica subsp. enterica serovar 9,12:-:1,5]EHF3058329.1 hypothetical protein [Salmonella enterica subsp. enterica serovar 9,12-:1,5]
MLFHYFICIFMAIISGFTGEANGFILKTFNEHDTTSLTHLWGDDVHHSIPLVDGVANVPVDIVVYKTTTGERDKLASAGAFSAEMNFEFQSE